MNKKYASEKFAAKLLGFLEKNKEQLSPLLILTHDYPDPDAIGSAVALQYIAKKLFKIKSKIVYGGIIGRIENQILVNSLQLPVFKLKKSDLKNYQNIALVDTQPIFKNNALPKNKKATLVIDQHYPDSRPDVKFYANDPGCGATCVILAQALLQAKIKIPTKIATALVYGIITDTSNFFRSHRPDVVNTYIDILPFCDVGKLVKIQNPRLSAAFYKTLVQGIGKSKCYKKLIFTHLGTISDPSIAAQVADMLLAYDGVEYALCTGRHHSMLRVSLRTTQQKKSAPDILHDILGGKGDSGGHGYIAGGSLLVSAPQTQVKWRQAENNLIKAFIKRLGWKSNLKFKSPF